jgi:hypothetical protein
MSPETIIYDGSVISWINENIADGQNFKVYSGDLCEENEISRDLCAMKEASSVTVCIMPSDLVSVVIAIVVAIIAVNLLTPDKPSLTEGDGGRKSPNNSLTDRRNKARPNARVPDICGRVKSILDVISSEYSIYVSNKETRYGYYCVGRNQVNVSQLKDGDSLISEIPDASAGVYYPGKSPNNSAPDVQIGAAINQVAYGVFRSGDAIGQTVLAPNEENHTILGPFNNPTVKCRKVLVNVYSPSGLYVQDGSARTSKSVSYRITVVKLDESASPIGTPYIVNETISGSNSNEKGKTTQVDLGGEFFFRVSVQRTSNADFGGQAVDEIKLKDIFGLYEVDKDFFGNTTTVQTKRIANAQNASIRNPEINCIATEMVYKYLGGGVFDTNLTENTQAMQSLIRLALDPYVGRRSVGDIDLDLMLENQALVESYFNSAEAGQFSYTFDDENTSAQEIFYTIANAAFCVLWREGIVLKSYFESPQTIPSMVFTHRSKQAKSERWTRETAQGKRKDSVELTYTDDKTYKQEVLYFPANRSGKNPKKVDIKGVKGLRQATWRLMREYNKLLFQRESVDFSSTIEGSLVKPMQLISVVKGTRVGSYDGEVLLVDGLTLTLSQTIAFTSGDDHFILLKKRDGSTESIPVIDFGTDRQLQLEYAPTESIYTGNSETKTEFSFGNEARLSGQLMLPLEIDASDGQYVNIKAINYSDSYYKDDLIQPVLSDFNNDFNNDFG